MVPVAKRDKHYEYVGKFHLNHSYILIQESYWITIHLYLVKQYKTESSNVF